MQTSVIEFARSVLSLERTDSTEFDEHAPNPVVVFMPEGSRTHMGSTVRLGSRRTLFQTPDCITSKLYHNLEYLDERCRHRYEDYFSSMRNDYGVQANSDHYSCIVDVLSRAGRLNEAYEVIRQMPVKVTAKAWGALLSACRTYGNMELAEIAGKALSEIEPGNPANYLLLARMYSSLGRHEEAQRMRREMKEKGGKAPSGTSWVVYQD